MKIFGETERLILREILPSDIDGMFALDSDPEVHRYLGNQPVKTKEETLEVINFIRQQYIDNGIGRWAIIDKQTNEFIGWTGLKWITEQTGNRIHYYDLGYRLVKKYWGKGIATESAIASLEYAFKHLNATEVLATADCENEGSNKILQKLGMRLFEKFDYDGIEHNFYIIEKKDFGL